MRLRGRSLVHLVVLALLAVGLFYMVSGPYKDPLSLQWDFHTYYHAPLAHAAGLSPYDAGNISLISGKNWTPPYLYPPLTLYIFSIFNVFDHSGAAKIWLLLKLSLLAVLVFVWGRYFTRMTPLVWFLLFLIFGFGSAVYWDIKSGNVSIVEQFLLWMGFLCLIKNRSWGFCLLLLLTSVFKLAFIGFLPLLLVFNVRHKWRYFFATALTFAGYILANYLLSPDLFSEYFNWAISVKDMGSQYNVGTLAFVKDAFIFFGYEDLKALPLLTYAGIVALVLFFTIHFLKSSRRALFNNKQLTIFLFCALYSVLMPRMKCYSFIILILPAYHIIRQSLQVRAFPYIFLLLVLPIRSPLSESVFVGHFMNYYSLYLAFLIWGLFIWHIRRLDLLSR